MNILVTGANGQLGRELRRASVGSEHHFIFSDISEISGCETVCLDVTNKEAVHLIAQSENIDLFINCAALTNVDKAEEDIVLSELLNHTAPKILAQEAKSRSAGLIHISTDFVFSGRQYSMPFKESDLPEPCNVYGSTKLAGESAVIKSGCKYLIIRTSWLYSIYGRNFVKTIRQMLKGEKDVRVVFDSVGTPTYAGDLADAIIHIINNGGLSHTGIYHYSNEGVASWYDFALAIKEFSNDSLLCNKESKCSVTKVATSVNSENIDNSHKTEYAAKIIPIRRDDYQTSARRPSFTVLDKTLIKLTFGLEIPYWRDSLRKCIESL